MSSLPDSTLLTSQVILTADPSSWRLGIILHAIVHAPDIRTTDQFSCSLRLSTRLRLVLWLLAPVTGSPFILLGRVMRGERWPVAGATVVGSDGMHSGKTT